MPTKKRKANDEINKLRIGDYVKISNGRERFWVEVKDFRKDLILGIVSNNLVDTSDYNYGDHIKFKKDNILELL